MKLTPLEIKQQTFEKGLRGYDTADVQAFLTLVSNEFEHLINKNKELEQQIDKLTERVKHYERVEDALHETLQTAKESMEQKVSGAKQEAKNTLEKAEMEADAIIKEANHNRQQIRQSILRLLDRREEIINGISSYLENAKKSVEQFSKDEMEVFQLPKEERLEESLENPTRPTKFMLDEENESGGLNSAGKGNEDEEEEDHAFPPGSDRLDDILDEID
ncbi:MAG: DivIVA domain-containing protein [Gracilimonas sp.]|uniref:DivIVA domain-containing protein n=1 Tax=Gracilimonas TaxID=649462 RepID=UPI001B0ACC8A|nr:DivIVA domain-containing protein [Gracilimonas sp.]MBO6584782.1 DivIVA domain-containing protein [Gracilimonas sp.]MBO6615947.1 DivIVA domain-containing protein [Gracilimonas sp.]